jgi:integrase
MPRLKANEIPRHRFHKGSNRGVVTLSGVDHYTGPGGSFGTPEAEAEYHRLTSEWLASGRRMLPRAGEVITVKELVRLYQNHAQAFYRKNGRLTTGWRMARRISDELGRLYGPLPVSDFGPLALKAIRASWIKNDVCRAVANQQTKWVRNIFLWGAEQELVSPLVTEALRSVKGLSKGRSEAKDHPPVQPVPWGHVEAVLPHVWPVVGQIIRFMWHTGARVGEACPMRPCEVERGGGRIWVYRPASHKTEHRALADGTERQRVILIGKEGRAFLGPILDRSNLKPDGWVFPARTLVGRHIRPERVTDSIRLTCLRLGIPHWHPHQIRHSFLSRVRKRAGIEAARILAGHSLTSTTEGYAERDLESVAEIIDDLG